jgi:hypothetical membrane protein
MERTTNSKAGKHERIAGSLLFLAGVIIFMGIITGEVFYPIGYSTSANPISDLGATLPPNSLIFQPSAMIFDSTMIATGVMILLGAYFFQRSNKKKLLSIPLGLGGLGLLGVGVFPSNYGAVHLIFAMLAFISAGIAAVLSAKVISGPYRHMSICLGSITLVTLLLWNTLIPLLGYGGTERWVAYPSTFWLTGFGAYLLGIQTAYASQHVNPQVVGSNPTSANKA